MDEISPAILAQLESPPPAAHPWVMAHFGLGDDPHVMYLRYKLVTDDADPEVSLTVVRRPGEEPFTLNLSRLFALGQTELWWDLFPTEDP